MDIQLMGHTTALLNNDSTPPSDLSIAPCHHLTLTLTTLNNLDKYPAKSHARRVATALSLTSPSTTLLTLSATPSTTYPNSDMPPPFRQNRYFYYLSGCPEPDCHITYDITKDVLTLWLPVINYDRLIWTGRGSTVEEALEKYDIDDARYYQSGFTPWTRLAHSASRLTLPEPLTGEQTTATPPPLKAAIDTCRVLKDAHEIQLIERANRITARAHRAVLSNLSAMTTESEVEAAFMSVCITHHARNQAYAPIAGSGPNASTLHYTANSEAFGAREVLVLDAGCEWECYASDVTRSMPLNGAKPGHWASGEGESVYRAVERMQEACLRRVKPGVRFWDLFVLAHRVAAEELVGMGVLRLAPCELENGGGGKKEGLERLVREGWTRLFFPHGLGHHMGLEVHDVSPTPLQAPPRTDDGGVGDFAAPCSRGSGALEAGMVVTVEPGLYFNREHVERMLRVKGGGDGVVDLEVLKGFYRVGGVRIEDDVLVTRDGYRNLTLEAGAVKGEEMLGVIREGAKREV